MEQAHPVEADDEYWTVICVFRGVSLDEDVPRIDRIPQRVRKVGDDRFVLHTDQGFLMLNGRQVRTSPELAMLIPER
jgi:hypothetical protein